MNTPAVNRPANRPIAAIVLALWMLQAPVPAFAGKEGFGSMKKSTAELTRVRPPKIVVTGTKIAVQASSQGRSASALANRVQGILESELIQRDRRLRLDRDKPETIVEVKILANDITKGQEMREVSEAQEYTNSEGKKKTKMVQVRRPFLVINQVVTASYSVHDKRTSATLYADSMEYRFDEAYKNGEGAPSDTDLEGNAAMFVAANIIPAVVPTTEQIFVLIPNKGTLKDISGLAEAGQWDAYLEALEVCPPYASKEDEAYRQYAFGVANEALAYQSEEAEVSLSFLTQAAQHYQQAIVANPGEEKFTEAYENKGTQFFAGFVTDDVKKKKVQPPIVRVKESLTQYQALLDFRQAIAAGTLPTGGEGGKAMDGGGGMTNQDVIDMVIAGLPEDIIISAIDDAEATAFDTTPNGLMQLAEGKVSTKIIKRIQAEKKK